jgi:nucleoside-diphosphate-sugar epimerase
MWRTLLVTGATGFVGRALVERLRAEGRPFRAAMREHDSSYPEGVEIGEIGPETKWLPALTGIDTVVHLAGLAHIPGRPRGVATAFHHVNAAGTANLAEQARKSGVRRFVLVSSVKAAADRSGRKALSEADPAEPGTPYGVSKLDAEISLRVIAGAMQTVILRPPLVYGPGVRANFLTLLRLVDKGMILPLGSVHNQRSLIARANLVDAILTAVDIRSAAGGTFYVSDGAPLSTPELIRAIAAALGKPARLVPFPPILLKGAALLAGRGQTADSLLGSLAVDDSAFRACTGWRPPVTSDAAFATLASWYRGRDSAPR